MSRCLIVDDQEQNIYLLQMILKGNGFEVENATDGIEALRKARLNPPDLVISDILMPAMDGFALCREWRKDNRLRTIPFIFYTATYTDTKDEAFGLSLGADRFLIKPLEPEILIAEITAVIRDKITGTNMDNRKDPLPDAAFLKEYNEALIRKLEDKMLRLRQANHFLKEKIQEHSMIEKQLREGEARQKALLSAIPDIIMEVDTNKIYTWANKPGFEFFGDDVIGKEADFYFTREQNTYERVQPVFNGSEDVVYIESWQRRKDGQERLLAWWCQTLKDGLGYVTGALSSARDITEQKLAEERLRESEDKFRYMFDNSAVGNSLTNLGGRVTVNRTFCNMLGYDKDELSQISWQDITHPEDVALTQREIDLMLAGEKDSARFIKRYIRKDGSVVWTDVSSSLRRDKDGIPLYFMTAIVDITESKQAEESVRESEQKYRLLFDEMISGYAVHEIICDQTGKPVDYRFLSVNAAFEMIIGLSACAIIGRTALEVLPAIESTWLERYGKVALTREPAHFEEYSAELNKYFEVRAFSPETGKFATIFNDITGRRKAEEEIKRLNTELEQRVIERTSELTSKTNELERINKLFVDRELRMRELKARIAELEQKCGKP